MDGLAISGGCPCRKWKVDEFLLVMGSRWAPIPEAPISYGIPGMRPGPNCGAATGTTCVSATSARSMEIYRFREAAAGGVAWSKECDECVWRWVVAVVWCFWCWHQSLNHCGCDCLLLWFCVLFMPWMGRFEDDPNLVMLKVNVQDLCCREPVRRMCARTRALLVCNSLCHTTYFPNG